MEGLDIVSLPDPEPGLVIRYSYLWSSEYEAGREEGVKDRPCAIILAALEKDGRKQVLVAPVTHSAPRVAGEAKEIPAATKKRLGLDDARSWVVLNEANAFYWPGPDVRRVGDQGNESIAYGKLPAGFLLEILLLFRDLDDAGNVHRVRRSE